MMALDCQPFSVVEDHGFVRLLNYLQPRYQVPGRKYFSSTMIPQLNERHTGDNIATVFSDCVCEWKIESKIVCALRDGGSNFVAGFNSSGVPSITCLAHSLQCVIHDGVLAQRDVQDLLAAGRRIVGHYKHSNVAFHLLQRIQAQLELKVCALYQDEPTRWNSSYYMLKRLVEQRKVISAANTEAGASFDLSAAQWKLAEKVISCCSNLRRLLKT